MAKADDKKASMSMVQTKGGCDVVSGDGTMIAVVCQCAGLQHCEFPGRPVSVDDLAALLKCLGK